MATPHTKPDQFSRPIAQYTQPKELKELGGVYVKNRFLLPRRKDPPKPVNGFTSSILIDGTKIREGKSPWKSAYFYKPYDLEGPSCTIDTTGNLKFTRLNPMTGQKGEEFTIYIVPLPFEVPKDRRSFGGRYEDMWLVSMSRDEVPSYCFWHAYPEGFVLPPAAADDQVAFGLKLDKEFQLEELKRLKQPRQDGSRRLLRVPDINPRIEPELDTRDDRKLWDQAWDRFRQVLEDFHADRTGKQTMNDVINTHFFEEQKLLLIPSIDDDIRFEIQEQNAQRYTDALSSDRFRGVPDNLVTKFTMLYFGLPIAPLTMTNILNSGGDANAADKADPVGGENAGNIQNIIYAEKPLEFLDTYHERFFGYPGLRIKKSGLQPHHEGAVPNLAEPTEFQMCGTVRNARLEEQRESQMKQTKEQMSLRGGGGGSDSSWEDSVNESIDATDSDGDNMDDNTVKLTTSENEDLLPPIHTGKFPIYSAIGRLYIHNEFSQFHAALKAIFGMNLAKSLMKHNFTFCVDLLKPEKMPTIAVRDDPKQYPSDTITASSLQLSGDWYNRTIKSRVDHYWHVRIRDLKTPNDSYWCAEGKDSISLIFPDDSIAYWRPLRTELSVAENQIQSGFREVLERLIPGYGQYDISWRTCTEEAKTGLLRLGGIAPTLDFYKAALELRYDEKKYEHGMMQLAVLDSADNFGFLGETHTHIWQGDKKVIVPGIPITSTPGESRIPEIKQGTKVTSKTLARLRTALAMRYAEGKLPKYAYHVHGDWQTYAVFPDRGCMLPETFEPKQDRKVVDLISGLSNIVARAYFPHFKIYNHDLELVGEWSHPLWSLVSFRVFLLEHQFVAHGTGYIALTVGNIKRNISAIRLVIEPTTTEEEWQKYVFHWFTLQDITIDLRNKDLDYYGPMPEQPNAGDPCIRRPVETRHVTFAVPESDTNSETTSTIIPEDHELGWPAPATAPAKAHASDSLKEWRVWQAQLHEQDDLRFSAYTDLHSVHRQSKGPLIPQYGQVLEDNIRSGSLMPTLYQAPMTPTQVSNLKSRVKTLENMVLQRIVACPICETQFEAGEHHKQDAVSHFQEHQRQLEAAGKCPVCSSSAWGRWTTEQKIGHFKTHGIQPSLDEHTGSAAQSRGIDVAAPTDKHIESSAQTRGADIAEQPELTAAAKKRKQPTRKSKTTTVAKRRKTLK